MQNILGASPEEWDSFLQYKEDLLPIVCDQSVPTAPTSKLPKENRGKVPSLIKDGFVYGIREWTKRITTIEEISRWKRDTRLGIGLQCRTIKAFDVDVDDPVIADNLLLFFQKEFPEAALRLRNNSKRFLAAFVCEGNFKYNSMLVNMVNPNDKIEFLADGKQFQAAGSHKSGGFYFWNKPPLFEVITEERLAYIWFRLCESFAVKDTRTIQTKEIRSGEPTGFGGLDPVGDFILKSPFYLGTDHNGNLQITCPWKHEHTCESGSSETIYMPHNTNGYAMGHFKCLHGHCATREDQDYLHAIGYSDSLFDVIELTEEEKKQEEIKRKRFEPISLSNFRNRPPQTWIIKNVLPRAELAVIFGESGSGKSFLALDMMMTISKGEDWWGKKTKKGNVVYICAEGIYGFAKRIEAYGKEKGLPDDGSFQIIDNIVNLMEKQDVKDLIAGIKSAGTFDVVVIDTLAQSMAGGNENTSEHMGLVLAHCRAINKATGALVVLIHHSGKDSSKGARGWSGVKGALDAELEVVREQTDDKTRRKFIISKLKDEADKLEQDFKLSVIELGVDEDLDKITSCIIDFVDPDDTIVEIKETRKKDSTKHIVKDTILQTVALLDKQQSYDSFVMDVCNSIGFIDNSDLNKLIGKVKKECSVLRMQEMINIRDKFVHPLN